VSDARALVAGLGDEVVFYKLGLELFMTGGYFDLLAWLVARGKRVFVDLKFFDVPETVRSAVRALRGRGIALATVHGNQKMMEAAAAEKGDVKILAVTVLTSLDRGDLDDLGFACDVEKLVLSRARRALEAGCDGVVSSGLEAPMLREFIDQRLRFGDLAQFARDPRHSPGREQAGGRPEAHRGRRAGVRQRR
jgi:orotidine-5'-phosphate decarboxylase